MNSEKRMEGAAAEASQEASLRIVTDEELLLAWGGISVGVSGPISAGQG